MRIDPDLLRSDQEVLLVAGEELVRRYCINHVARAAKRVVLLAADDRASPALSATGRAPGLCLRIAPRSSDAHPNRT